MALTTTPFSSNLGAILITYDDTTSTAATNTRGAAGTLYMLRIDNSLNSASMYFKIVDGNSATPGTTSPDFVFRVRASTKTTYVFPTGLVFSTGFTHWCVTAGGTAGTTSATADVTVNYITS